MSCDPNGMSTVILIAGPTASGKSALALELAAKLRGVIINADSMQVYRDLRIITARPTPDEEKRISHRLYGHVDAAENYSVGGERRHCGGAVGADVASHGGDLPPIGRGCRDAPRLTGQPGYGDRGDG